MFGDLIGDVTKRVLGSPLGEVVFFVADLPIEGMQPGVFVVALVTGVSNTGPEPTAALMLFPAGGLPVARTSVPYDALQQPGTWHYR